MPSFGKDQRKLKRHTASFQDIHMDRTDKSLFMAIFVQVDNSTFGNHNTLPLQLDTNQDLPQAVTKCIMHSIVCMLHTCMVS
jgi:hypothetical protein